MHYGGLGALSAIISIGVIILRFLLKKSDKKAMLRALMVLWLVLLIICGVFIGLQTAESYIPSRSIITGQWVEMFTGRFLGYEYDSVGGQGSHPAIIACAAMLSFAVIGAGLGFGLSTITSKEKSTKSKIAVLAVFAIFIYSILRRMPWK